MKLLFISDTATGAMAFKDGEAGDLGSGSVTLKAVPTS